MKPAAALPRARRPLARFVRMLFFYVLALAALYGVLLLILAASQEWLLFPGRWTQGRSQARFEAAPGSELIELESASGDRVAALFAPALSPDGEPLPDAAQAPGLLYFYGNGTWLASARPRIELLRRLGVNVLCPDYPGYGLSEGRAGAAGFAAAAEAAYEHLEQREDVARTLPLVAGTSLGGAVAVRLASARPVSGLIVVSSFTSLDEVCRTQYPWIPVKQFLRHRWNSEQSLRSIEAPLMVIHGTADPLIPFTMAERLAGAPAGRAELVRVDGADHNDVFERGGDRLVERLAGFVVDCTGRLEAPPERLKRGKREVEAPIL